jgi:hypothetical protein
MAAAHGEAAPHDEAATDLMRSRLLNVQVRDLYPGDKIVGGLEMNEIPEVVEPGITRRTERFVTVAVRIGGRLTALQFAADLALDIDRPNMTIHGL